MQDFFNGAMNVTGQVVSVCQSTASSTGTAALDLAKTGGDAVVGQIDHSLASTGAVDKGALKNIMPYQVGEYEKQLKPSKRGWA